jgi:hypothetical protein
MDLTTLNQAEVEALLAEAKKLLPKLERRNSPLADCATWTIIRCSDYLHTSSK